MSSQWQLQTPVAFFIFNRPDTTARVFDSIRRAAPSRLLVVADGPRAERGDDAQKCAAARDIVAKVDWPCEVSTDFSEANLGCRRRLSTGLDWVFGSVEEAIILEDDCLPDQSFFHFCEELLEKYRDDRRIMMISGDNYQFGRKRTLDSYYFSRYPHIWGWACWRRSWELYDVEMNRWPQVRDGGWLEDCFSRPGLARYWKRIFEAVYRGEIDTWDYQLTFSCLANHALCIMPAVNLVSNIGFGADAAHTREKCRLAEMATEAISFPLQHPPHLFRDASSDYNTECRQFPHSAALRVRNLLYRMFRRQ